MPCKLDAQFASIDNKPKLELNRTIRAKFSNNKQQATPTAAPLAVRLLYRAASVRILYSYSLLKLRVAIT